MPFFKSVFWLKYEELGECSKETASPKSRDDERGVHVSAKKDLRFIVFGMAHTLLVFSFHKLYWLPLEWANLDWANHLSQWDYRVEFKLIQPQLAIFSVSVEHKQWILQIYMSWSNTKQQWLSAFLILLRLFVACPGQQRDQAASGQTDKTVN